MSWEDVQSRIDCQILNILRGNRWKAFGIPKGGSVVAAMLPPEFRANSPKDADVLVDDIIDSGRTAARWEKMFNLSTLALVNKIGRHLDRKLPWVVFPWECEIESGPGDSVVRLLQFIGEDPQREGLLETPKRVLAAWKELTSGYRQDPGEILSKTFSVSHDEMVVLRGIRWTSVCEHHLLPFSGEATLAYVPGEKVVGISKLARLLECFARRLQVQERMTEQIAQEMMIHLQAKGAAVILRAHHSCMGCRGVRQPDAEMVTSCLLGVIRERSEARAELLSLSGG